MGGRKETMDDNVQRASKLDTTALSDALDRLGIPIFSRSYSMRTGKDRVQVEAMNGPVNIGDARVLAGDLLRGDADGVVVIPKVHEDEILHVAEEIDATEEKIRRAVLEGMRLSEARKLYGYHQLQSKK